MIGRVAGFAAAIALLLPLALPAGDAGFAPSNPPAKKGKKKPPPAKANPAPPPSLPATPPLAPPRPGANPFEPVVPESGPEEWTAAARKGLEWLAKSQEADGHWDCGKLGGERKPSHDVAVTGIALHALASAAEPDRTAFARNIRKALDWLAAGQAADGGFSANNYAHGMATLGALEAGGMDPARRESFQKAVDAVAARQKPSGGWDYGDRGDPARNRGDTSVTGWQIASLKKAEGLGLRVPAETFERAKGYFRAATSYDADEADGVCAYEIVDGKKTKGGRTITAITVASLCRLGAAKDLPFFRKTFDELSESSPVVSADNMCLYSQYYYTQVFTEFRSKTSGKLIRRSLSLLAAQQLREGAASGSWAPEKDNYGKDGGRVFVTALACLCLEIAARPLADAEKKGRS